MTGESTRFMLHIVDVFGETEYDLPECATIEDISLVESSVAVSAGAEYTIGLELTPTAARVLAKILERAADRFEFQEEWRARMRKDRTY